MGLSELEATLVEKGRSFLAQAQGLRPPRTEDIFRRRLYISPEAIRVENHLRRRPPSRLQSRGRPQGGGGPPLPPAGL